MKIAELLKQGAEILSKNLEDINAMFESELLLSFVLEKERIYLAVNRHENIDDETADLFFSYILRRAASEPISYITGEKEFMSLKFCVCPKRKSRGFCKSSAFGIPFRFYFTISAIVSEPSPDKLFHT